MAEADKRADRLERRAKSRESREERERFIAKQREQFRTRERNKRIFNYALLALVIAAIGYGIFVYTRSDDSGAYDGLAQCLTERESVMYGTDWCPHCQEQKQLFGRSFRYVTFVNCDLNRDACDKAGVQGYPTWVFSDGSNATGLQPLSALAARAQCPFTE